MAVGFSGASGDTLTRTTNLFATANFSACIFARVGDTGSYITPLGMWGSSEILLQFGSASPEIYNGGVVCNSANSYSLNDWVFLGMVANGTDNSGDEWALYDGLANAASALTKTNGSRASSFTPTTFRVGESNYGEYMDGALVALKVWTASLTDAEMELERRQLAPVRTANLWGFFPLLNTADKLKDFGGNGYDLTNGTGPWTEEANPPVRWRSGHRKPVYVAAGGGATEYSRTASLGAVIQAEQAKTASLSAVLQASDSRTASLSALIQAEGLLASSLSALIQAELQRSASLNAVVQAALERTTSLSAVLQVAQALSTGASAVIQSEEVRTSALSAIVQAALSGTANLSAVVQAELSQATSLDAIITATGSGLLTASLSALIQAEGLRSASLSAVVQAAITATASLSAVVQAEGSQTSNLSAVVQAEGQRAATLSGVVQAEGAKSVNLSAVLQAALALSASLDAVVSAGGGGGTLSASLSAVIADALLARWRLDEGPDVTEGLLHWWRCDDANSATMEDAVGGVPLTVAGSVPFVAGKHGSARAFPGVTGSYARASAPTADVAAIRDGAWTVAFWFKRPSTASHTDPVLLLGPPNDTPTESEANNYALYVYFYLSGSFNQRSVYWERSNGTGVGQSAPTATPADTNWHHFAVSSPAPVGGLRTLYFYDDGVLVATHTGLAQATGCTAPAYWWVGAYFGASPSGSHSNLSLDDLRVYTRVLSDTEVAQLAGLPALQLLDDQGGAHLTPTGGPLPVQGKLGRARRFWNEAGNPVCYAATPGAIPAQMAAALRAEYTICGWVRRAATPASLPHVFLAITGDSSGPPEQGNLLEVMFASPGDLEVWGALGTLVGGSVPFEVWTHVAVRRVRSGVAFSLELLINAALVDSDTEAAVDPVLGNSAQLSFGAELWPGTYAAWAELDDWRIYQRALTDAELAVIARGGAGVRKVNALNAGASSAAVESGARGATITDDGRRNWRDDG